MPEKEILELDEERRVTQHEAVKDTLRREVHREVEEKAVHPADTEKVHVEAVAQDLRQRAVAEVGHTEQELGRARQIARLNQFVGYLFSVIYGLVGLMIGLELLGAREGADFMRFMSTVTAPLLAPFKGLMPDPAVGSFQLMLSYVIALVVYLLLHQALRGFLRLLAQRRTGI